MQGMLLNKILTMSLTGSYCILVVLLIRLLLKKCDRKYAYYLWFVVFLNLCLPFSLMGSFSLIPKPVAEFSVPATGNAVVAENTVIAENAVVAENNVITENNEMMESDAEKPENTANVATGIFMQGNERANGVASGRQQDATVQKMSPMAVAQAVWLMGILLILLWNLISVRKLQRRIMAGNAVSLDESRCIVEVDSIDTPFLWGIFKPVIYLPVGMDEQEKSYIVAHESYHKHRKDYLAKIIVSAVVMLHWFNPLVWVAYALFCRDMEISCDEAVLSRTAENIKKQYAESLLKYAAKQNGYVITPLTFGEPSVKTRIKNALRFQKKGVLLSGIAFILVLGVALGLIFRPKADGTVPVEEKDLLEIMQNASGYRTENYIYVDMDHDGIAYKQYAATAISEEEFLQFENADTLQSVILEECNLEDTEKLELTYFKRSNGILHVQCARHDSGGFIHYFYYTVKYEGGKLISDLSDCRNGQMAETFTNLDVLYT